MAKRKRRFDRRAVARRSRRANISEGTKGGLIAAGIMLLVQAGLLVTGVLVTRRLISRTMGGDYPTPPLPTA